MRCCASTTLLLVCLTGPVRAQDDARAIVAKAIKAQGGEEKLSKIRAGKSKLRGTYFEGGNEFPLTVEEMFALPNRIKISITMKTRGLNILEVVDGEKGWIGINGKVTEATPAQLDRMKQQVYLNRVTWLTPLLQDKAFELSPLKEVKAGDRTLVGVKVSSKGQSDARIYFDKESYLLVRIEYPTKNNRDREVMQEDNFSNFSEVNGIKMAKKMVAVQDGKKLMEVEVIEAEFPESIPAKEFSKP
jgi:hypothetical protein